MISGTLTYEQFGAAFVHTLITPDRVSREVRQLLVRPIEGAISIIPGELLSAQYVFQLVDVHVKLRPELKPDLALRQRITGSLALSVKILGVPFRFTLQVGIRLEQLIKAQAPLLLCLETRPLDHASVDIDVDAHGLPSEILDKFNLIEGAVRTEVVAQVNKRLASGPIADATRIDIQRLAEGATLSRITAPRPSPPADPMADVTRLVPKEAH